MRTSSSKLMFGVAACALLLAGCSSDGLTVGASNGLGASAPGSSQAPPDNSNDGSGSGSGTTGSGTGSGDTGSGTGSGSQSMLGGGTVTVTAGGTTATTPSAASLAGNNAGSLLGKADRKGSTLLSTGNALLPTGKAAGAVQPVAGSLPASANINNTALGGPATQPVGVSVLSNSQAPGSVATAGVASAGQTGAVTVNTAGTPVGGVAGSSAIANVTAGHQNIVTGNSPLVGASVASPTQNPGSVVSAGVLSNGHPATATITGKPVTLPGKNVGGKRLVQPGPSPQGH